MSGHSRAGKSKAPAKPKVEEQWSFQEVKKLVTFIFKYRPIGVPELLFAFENIPVH